MWIGPKAVQTSNSHFFRGGGNSDLFHHWPDTNRIRGLNSWLSCPGAALKLQKFLFTFLQESSVAIQPCHRKHTQQWWKSQIVKNRISKLPQPSLEESTLTSFGPAAPCGTQNTNINNNTLSLESDTMCHWLGKKPSDCLLHLLGGVNKLPYSEMPSWFRHLTRICFSNMAAGTWPQIINIQLSSSTLAHLQGSKTWVSH